MIKMREPYWIVDSTIIFKPEFNKYLDDYSDIISNYKILYFSNYINPHITLKNNNECNYDDYIPCIKKSVFNLPLGTSLSNLTNLKQLTFGWKFNQPLDDSLSNLTNLEKLTFGDNFNSSLDDSLLGLTNLQKLTFGNYFNKPLDDSLLYLHNLRELNFDMHFDQSLTKFFNNNNNGNDAPENNIENNPENNMNYFPKKPLSNSLSNLVNLQKLTFGLMFNHSLDDCLSNLHNLRELHLNLYFNQPINIPGWIKKLYINCNQQHIIDYLPSSIEELVFGIEFGLELNNLPSSIKKIKIENNYYNEKLNNLPNGIERLEISSRYKMPIDKKYENLLVVKF